MAHENEDTNPRRWLPLALVILASVVGLVSIFALWAKRQLLETETWADTSIELLEDREITDAVADFAVEELFTNVDIEAALTERLPPVAQPLASPLAGGLRRLADEAARDVLQQPKVQALWEEINRDTHADFLKLIEDEGEFTSTAGGAVTLDLRAVVAEIASQIGLPATVADRLPEETAQLEIMKADELDAARTGVDALRTAAYVLTGLTLLLFALAIYLARDRRRETLRAVGFAFVAVGAVVLFAHAFAGDAITASLADNAAAESPVRATWVIGTSLLSEAGQSIVAYGLVIVLAAWLAGPTGVATSIRRVIAPHYRRPEVALGGAAVLLALIFWWSPTQATQRLVPSLLLIALLGFGAEVLRRRIVREFPEHVPAGPGRAAAPAKEDRVSALERLAKLRETGALTDEEFASEKSRILGSP